MSGLKGVIVEKIWSIALGGVSVIFFSLFLPIYEGVFYAFRPVDSFIEEYFLWCIAVAAFTVAFWSAVIRFCDYPVLFSSVIITMLLSVVAMMRYNILLGNIIPLQFLIFFAAVLLLCEGLVLVAIHWVRLVWIDNRASNREKSRQSI